MSSIEEPLPATNGEGAAQSRTIQAYDELRRAILHGELAPGSKLKIDVLRQLLGTGASPIREALSLLTSDQLVDRVDQRGFRVARVSEAGFQELLLTRAWVEERALRESLARGDNAWEEGVVVAHYHLSRTPRSPEASATASGEHLAAASPEWERRHRDFHFSLLSACGSSLLLRFRDQLYDQNIRYRNLAGRVAYPMRDINHEHEQIMKAALDRDADAAVEALLSHYRRTGAFLSAHIV